MPATITGIVFNDLNHNGQYDPGEPGIPGVFVVLYNTSSGLCTPAVTDAGGVYSFSITTAGTYRVYETVEDPGTFCPPSTFTQPEGFTVSNGPRVLSSTVTATQITNNAVSGNQNFSHDTNDNPLACTRTLVQFVNEPTRWYNIDVVTGVSELQGFLNPINNVNAIGYNLLDNYIYGYDQTVHRIVRVDNAGNLMQISPNPTGLPSNDFNVGTFDLDGHLFLFVNATSRFYTVDLNQESATFMKLVDPTNGYIEQTSNFGTALSTSLNVSDWAYNPTDGFLYGVESVGNTSRVDRVNPATGTVTNLTTTAPVLNPAGRSWGAVAMDASGQLFAIYNGNGNVYRYTISGNTANGVYISTTFETSFNNAAMCPAAEVGAIADMSVVKTTVTSPVVAGRPIMDSLTVANGGPDSAENVILTDALPPQIDNAEYSLDGINYFPWTGSLNLGTFINGQSETVYIRGDLSPSVDGAFSNTAEVGSDAQDPNPDNNISTDTVDVETLADMSAAKTASPDPVTAGQQITFRITVSNLGPSDAHAVTLADDIPAAVTGAEYSNDGGISFIPWPGLINLGTFSNGEVQEFIIRGTVASAAAGTIVNTAVVDSPTPDPNPDNNTSTSVTAVNESADVAVEKTQSPDPLVPGQQGTYTIIVSNLGPSDAQDVVLSDAIPPQFTGAEYSTDGISFFPWTGMLALGTMTDGEVRTILIRGLVSLNPGVITNTAVVSSLTPDPNPDNNTSTVISPNVASADLSVVKTAAPNPVTAGEVLTYTMVVANAGPDEAENVTLTDAIPGVLSDVEYSVDNGTTFNPWTGTYLIGTLSDGESKTVLIRGTVNLQASGIISNTAVVDSTTFDPNPDNNTSTVNTGILAFCGPRCRAVSDLIESVALEEAGIAHILNAEGEKLQKIIGNPGTSTCTLLQANNSVKKMVNSTMLLNLILQSKLGLFEDCICGDPQDCSSSCGCENR